MALTPHDGMGRETLDKSHGGSAVPQPLQRHLVPLEHPLLRGRPVQQRRVPTAGHPTAAGGELDRDALDPYHPPTRTDRARNQLESHKPRCPDSLCNLVRGASRLHGGRQPGSGQGCGEPRAEQHGRSKRAGPTLCVARCQWPSSSPQRRPRISPLVAISFSPLAATNLPTNRNACFRCLVEWFDPLAGGRLGEAVAVLAVGDQDVRVVQQPLDGRGREALGHQLVEP